MISQQPFDGISIPVIIPGPEIQAACAEADRFAHPAGDMASNPRPVQSTASGNLYAAATPKQTLVLPAAREPDLTGNSRIPSERGGSRIVLIGIPEGAAIGSVQGHAGVIAPAASRVAL